MTSQPCANPSTIGPVLVILLTGFAGIGAGIRLIVSLRRAHDPVLFKIPRNTRALAAGMSLFCGCILVTIFTWYLILLPNCG